MTVGGYVCEYNCQRYECRVEVVGEGACESVKSIENAWWADSISCVLVGAGCSYRLLVDLCEGSVD